MGFIDYIYVTVVHREIFESGSEISRIPSLLSHYPLKQVLGVLGRLSAGLANDSSLDLQIRLCRTLLDKSAATRAISVLQQPPSAVQRRRAVFHDAQILNLAKIAIQVLPATGGPAFQPPYGLGEALLLINQFMRESSERAGINLMLNATFHAQGPMNHALARAYDMYLAPHDTSSSYSEGMRATFERITGLPVSSFWAVTFALISRWVTFSLKTDQHLPDEVSFEYFLDSHLRLTEPEKRAVRMFAVDVSDVKSSLPQFDVNAIAAPYDLLEVQRCPFILVDGQPIVLAARQLRQLLASRIHHFFLDPGRTSPKERDLFLTNVGAIFSDYVRRSLARGIEKTNTRLLDLDKCELPGQRHKKSKGADFILYRKHQAVVIEVKASQYTAKAVGGADADALDKRHDEIYIEGAEQIDSTIRAVKAGLLSSYGIRRDGVKRFFPVVVTLQNAPTNPIAYGDLCQKVRDNGFLCGKGIEAIQPMDVGELEFFEAAMVGGHAASTILREKVNRMAGVPWSHFFVHRMPAVAKEGNEYLAVLTEKLTKEAREFYADRLGLTCE